MKLNELSPVAGSTKIGKRKGRGIGTGNGKTGGRGHKGQGQRSGGNVRPGFEGGQSPLMVRLPKRGFNNARFATVYAVVNVGDLERFDAGSVIDLESLKEQGLVGRTLDGIKLLARGEITKAVTVKINACSESAKAKIEAAGGKIEVL